MKTIKHQQRHIKKTAKASKVTASKKKKKTLLSGANYSPVITTCASITQDHVDLVCAHIEAGQFLETSCLLENILPKAFRDLMTQKYNKRSGLSKYASDAVMVAMARAEAKFISAMLDANNYNGTQINAIKDFLCIVNPRFHSKYKIQMKYELNAMLDVVKNNVSKEQFLNILDDLRQMSSAEVVAALDEKLLNE